MSHIEVYIGEKMPFLFGSGLIFVILEHKFHYFSSKISLVHAILHNNDEKVVPKHRNSCWMSFAIRFRHYFFKRWPKNGQNSQKWPKIARNCGHPPFKTPPDKRKLWKSCLKYFPIPQIPHTSSLAWLKRKKEAFSYQNWRFYLFFGPK